ncbi:MAG: tetratricopeptide repeat protein [Candidatus Latescibacterota bacterium]|nr:MAG: tetratricopeptide repeat protein [Candidatus Latescibacterota bacterium]
MRPSRSSRKHGTGRRGSRAGAIRHEGQQKQAQRELEATQRGGPAAPSLRAVFAWVGPLLLLASVAAGVWFFVFRESASDRVDRLVGEAREAMELYEYGRAELLLLEAIDTIPESAQLHHNLGALYVRMERWEDARLAFETAASLVGSDPNANEVLAEEYFQLASMNIRLNRYEEAELALENAIAARPTHKILHTRLIDLQLGYLGKPELADSSTSRFLRLCGGTPENLRDAAWIHYRRNSFKPAIELAGAAAQEVDSMIAAHVIVAKSYWKAQLLDDGLAYVAGPLQRYPDEPALWVAKGSLQIGRGRYDEALESLDRAIEIEPSRYEAHQARMMEFFNANRLQESMEQARICYEMTENENERRFLQSHIHRIQERMREQAPNESGGGGP